jgi:large subunit ribosomal protein L4
MGMERVMLVADEVDQNLYLASRNLVNVYVTDVNSLDPVNLIRFPKVLFTKGALKKIEEVLV